MCFSALGEMSKPTEITYKRLASLLSTKHNQLWLQTVFFIITGSHYVSAWKCFTAGRPQRDVSDFSIAVNEGRLHFSHISRCIFKVFH